jgi:hypothetical protein
MSTRFVLPDRSDVSRLVAAFDTSPLSQFLGPRGSRAGQLQESLAQFSTPWLRADEALRSISGFANLHGMCRALAEATNFDRGLAELLRSNLGDWRDPISWPPDIFTSLKTRSDFYASLGFNHDLTDFPVEAFDEGLGIVGLRRDPPPLVVLYGPPVPVGTDGEQETAFVRTNTAHDWLQRLESQIRVFIR